MRIVLQEAKDAKVTVDGKTVGAIDKGEMILVSFTQGDNDAVIDRMIDKLLKLRVFSDDSGLTNLTLAQVGGNILAVSQFTLYASLRKGNRPSFEACLRKEEAAVLFDRFKAALLAKMPNAQFGIFHADMLVSFTNVGPFTILLDSKELGFDLKEGA